jgi:ribonuclease T1
VPSAPGGGGGSAGGPGSTVAPTPGGVATPASATDGRQVPILLSRFAVGPPPGWDGDTISLGELPPEARDTLLLVASGGPFPYEQDDATFQNREGILPDQPVGYYAEYTVETPGSADRGARRLVVGDERYVYYTADHYDTFSFVTP